MVFKPPNWEARVFLSKFQQYVSLSSFSTGPGKASALILLIGNKN